MSERQPCLVCMYRQDGFDDGHEYPVNAATHVGASMVFCAQDVPVCPDHTEWVTDEFPETLRVLEEMAD